MPKANKEKKELPQNEVLVGKAETKEGEKPNEFETLPFGRMVVKLRSGKGGNVEIGTAQFGKVYNEEEWEVVAESTKKK